MKVSNADILRFLNGESTSKEKAQVDAWMADNTANMKEIQVLQDAWKELSDFGDFKMPYTETAWQSVQSKALSTQIGGNEQVTEAIQTGKQDHTIVASAYPNPIPNPTKAPDIKSNSSPVYRSSTGPDLRWLYGILGLILLALLTWAILHFAGGNKKYEEITAGADEQIIALDDGSTVYLQPYGLLKYPKNMEAQPQRRISLDGAAKFDVVDSPRPFIVEYDDVSVQTLATMFDVSKDGDAFLAECIDGRIRFFETENVENGVEINEGEIYKYLNGVFENVTPPVEIDLLEDSSQGESIRLDALLDLLMEKSDWKVTSSPSMPFNPSYEVVIDVDADYETILQSLGSKLDFIYEQASCTGCYVIKHMTGRVD